MEFRQASLDQHQAAAGQLSSSSDASARVQDDKPKKRIAISCEFCRHRKIRCTGRPAPCLACAKANVVCEFRARARRPKTRESQRKEVVESLASSIQSATGPSGTWNVPLQEDMDFAKLGEHRTEESDSSGYQSDPPLTIGGSSGNPGEYIGKTAIGNFISQPAPKRKTAPKAGPSTAATQPMQHLPSNVVCDELIDNYFHYLHPVSPILDRKQFVDDYRLLWQQHPMEPLQRSLFYFVLALGCHFGKREKRRAEAETFGTAAMNLLTPRLLGPCTIKLVQSLILCTLWLQTTKTQIYSWNSLGLAVRVGHGLGLHVDDPTLPDRMLRITIWQTLFMMDGNLSIAFGRPRSNIRIEEIVHCLEVQKQSEGERYPAFESLTELYTVAVDIGPLIYDVRPSADAKNEAQLSPMISGILLCDERWREWDANLPIAQRYPADGINANHTQTFLRINAAFYHMIMHLPAADVLKCRTSPVNEQAMTGFKSQAFVTSAKTALEAARALVAAVKTSETSSTPLGFHWHNSFALFHASMLLIGIKKAPKASWITQLGLFGPSEDEALATAMQLLANLTSMASNIETSFQMLQELLKEDEEQSPPIPAPVYPTNTLFLQPSLEMPDADALLFGAGGLPHSVMQPAAALPNTIYEPLPMPSDAYFANLQYDWQASQNYLHQMQQNMQPNWMAS